MFHRPLLGHRFFFALRPPAVHARRISVAAHWFEDRGEALAAERLHVTLFILDDLPRVPDGLTAALTGIGRALAAAPFEVALDRAVGSRRSVTLRPSHRPEPLFSLHHQLADLARSAGLAERADYRFSPHLTLGYRDGEPFQQSIAPVRWRAEEVVLIHSHLGQTRHETVGRWPLRAVPDPQGSLF